jgi:hypothetical protein
VGVRPRQSRTHACLHWLPALRAPAPHPCSPNLAPRANPIPPCRACLCCSLADLAQQAGLGSPQEAELAVLRMIDAGEVCARIRWVFG